MSTIGKRSTNTRHQRITKCPGWHCGEAYQQPVVVSDKETKEHRCKCGHSTGVGLWTTKNASACKQAEMLYLAPAVLTRCSTWTRTPPWWTATTSSRHYLVVSG